MYIGLLNPLLKLSQIAEEDSRKLSSIESLTINVKNIAQETSIEIKKQTSVLTEIRDLIKDQVKSVQKDNKLEEVSSRNGLKPLNIKETGMMAFMVVGMTAAVVGAAGILSIIPVVSPAKLLTAIAVTAALGLMTGIFTKISENLTSNSALKNEDGSIRDTNPKGIFSLIKGTLLSLVGMSAAIAVSSYAFQLIMPVSGVKLLTALGIAATLYLISPVFVKVTEVLSNLKEKGFFKDINPKNMLTQIGGTLGVIIGMSATLALSSLILNLIVPVSPTKLLTAALIGIALIPISFAYSLILKSIRKVSTKEAVLASVSIPLIALGIAGAAHIFNEFLPDTFKTPPPIWSLTVGLAMLAFSFSFSMIMKSIKGANLKEIAFTAIATAALSIAIVGVAHIFNYLPGDYIAPPVEWTLKSALAILAFGIGFASISVLFKKTGIGFKDLFIGTVGVIAISVAILSTAWIFSILPGNFVSPPMEWALSSAIALTLFSIPVIVIGLIASSGIGAAGILLGVVGMIVIAAGMLAVAWIFNYMPDLGAIGQNITNGLLAPVNGIVNLLARFKNEIGIENLLPLAGGIVAISGSLLVLAGATAGVAAAGLGSALMDVGKAFLSWVSGKKTEGPMEILLKLANNYAKISALANPLNSVADSFVKFSKYANISQVESINALIKSVVEPITPDHAKSLGISNITDYMNTYATTVNKVASAYGLIANHSKAMNVEAIQSTTEMFKALAYLATVGKDTALKELGDKLVSAVKELALMIADFEGTVKEAGEQNIEANSGVGSAITDLKGAIGSLFGSKSGAGTSNVNIDTSEVVDAIERLERKLTSVGVKVNNNI